MTTYILNRYTTNFLYDEDTTEINIGCINIDKLNDSETIEFISDALTHEHIHRVIHRLFDITTCRLFDAIEYMFRNDKLHNKALTTGANTTRETYQAFIKRTSFKAFLDWYHIDETNVNQSYIICNTRLNNE